MNDLLFTDAEADDVNRETAESDNRLEADRVTAHWKTGGTRALTDLSETPLFGGPRQKTMFED